MCFVLTCAFYLRIKSHWCDWKKTVHTVISQWKTHRVYASRRSSATYSCSRPNSSRRVTKPGPFSEIWLRDLQLLESRSEKIRRTVVRESEVNHWLYVVLIFSERSLHERSNWLTRQIFKRKINIREDKLLLYHCLLELGLPKVNVSEQVSLLYISADSNNSVYLRPGCVDHRWVLIP
jgi:hypothetical protein